MRGRKPKPTALKIFEGNPGRRPINGAEPRVQPSVPSCPDHLTATARAEWERLADVLAGVGLLTEIDRAVLATYCQAYGRWVEAEEQLAQTPPLLKTPAGYVQQSPWITISNKQVELMARLMAEMGLTPSARSRLAIPAAPRRPPWEFDGTEDGR